MSESSYIDDVIEVKNRIGRVPSLEDYKKYSDSDMADPIVIMSEYGDSWVNIRNIIKINNYQEYHDKELILSLDIVADQIEESPSIEQYESIRVEDMPSYRDICENIGWIEAKKQIGAYQDKYKLNSMNTSNSYNFKNLRSDTNSERIDIPKFESVSRVFFEESEYTKLHCIVAFLYVRKKIGRSPKRSDYTKNQEHYMPTASEIKSIVGKRGWWNTKSELKSLKEKYDIELGGTVPRELL